MTEQKAKFLEGDLFRHITVMSVSASVGLLAIFLVDFVDLYFISLLGQKELAAAVGFAGTVIFAVISFNIGFLIAASALVARRLGEKDVEGARQITTSVSVLSAIVGVIVSVLVFIFAEALCGVLGASGETKEFAGRYLRIIAPTMPFGTLGMVLTGILRAHGDARRAMTATVVAAVVNAVLDPILIFGLNLGLDGAAIASAISRLFVFSIGAVAIVRVYGGFAPFTRDQFLTDLGPILSIAVPGVLTNIATPLGSMFVMRAMADFGDAAVAGFAVVSRMTPLLFCVLFALSGAIGPIIGQNFGALNMGRVRETVVKSLIFAAGYTLVATIIAILCIGPVVSIFGLMAPGDEIVFWFAVAVSPIFLFNGALFVANASFNNLHRPVWSAILNWGRNTLGVIPFVAMGAQMGGAPGVVVGHAIGGIAFALIGIGWLFYLLDGYEKGRIDPKSGSSISLERARPTPPLAPRG